MALTVTKYEHITLDEKGSPVITGTTLKVIELVAEKAAYGWSPEELHFQHPYLTLGQIHSALSYYYDHEEKLSNEIDRRLKNVQQYMPSGKTPLRERLHDRGLL
ncbi:MAG: DUF433 domain-containing protein [Nitrospirota bacterium]|nr:DUF433 domain-containing protein [Nitrospirota bacterium]